jgi:ribosomal protein S12 methylthiotransferase accessory factor
VDPNEFQVYRPEQFDQPNFQFHPFNEDTQVHWVEAINLNTNQACHVPAILVYAPYLCAKQSKERPIWQSITTGLACHCSQTEAVIAGLCEVIERDAFTITWQAQLTRDKIALSSLSQTNKQLVSRFEQVGYQVHLINITMDNNSPSIMAILRSDNPNTLPIVTSASTAMDPEDSVRKALEELAHTERHATQLKQALAPLAEVADFTNIKTQSDHLIFWGSHQRAHLTDFLINSTTEINFNQLPNLACDDINQELQLLVKNIAATGHQPLFSDVTSADISSLGIHVIRAIIPGYQPLIMGHNNRALGNKRLWQLPQQLGLSGRVPAQGDFPYPHPFP